MAGSTTRTAIDRIERPWGDRTPYTRGERWPTRVDTQLAGGVTEADVDRWVPAASLLHSNGDAMDIAVKDETIVGVRGRGADRVNAGRLGPKDLYGWQANNSADRLTRPLVRRGGELVESDWDTAMDAIVDRCRALISDPDHGPEAIGFYTSGQLYLEEYYTLGVIARAGIGTPHLDGNTRLCTATAAEALKESFGSDGQPGSYSDVDHTDTIALFGHNVAATQTVLWMRILDRLDGPTPPRLICVDPRRTAVAERADIHLAPRPGTNLALMNGLLHEIIRNHWYEPDFVTDHTVGFADLARTAADYPPARVADICGIDAGDLMDAAELIGTTDRLLSTVLQGFYQSHQATAAAVQVNNIHLLRAMLGRPGCGVLQMNGQPTAQNTRECGANGDLPGFRNWANEDHVHELAELWDVSVDRIPHDGPPTHAMEIFRLAETGSVRLLWISATNPAVSLPELARIRDILGDEELFVVAQDLFRTETAELADVVLPAATWGEKTGTFTNADRTVHLAEKAVDPPGAARADLDIFVDFAARMDFRDQHGRPLIRWADPEGAFRAWQRCSAGRPCDYTGFSYEFLRAAGGTQWPLPAGSSAGTERLYVDRRFPTDADECETFGKDIADGTPVSPSDYRARDPHGRALLKAATYSQPREVPSEAYPFSLITGRTLYHFHTRTKTGRAPELQAAAPEVWVQVNPDDARTLEIEEGQMLEIINTRSRVHARARIGDVRPGVLFLPFHYGYWDVDDSAGHDRAANELTPTDWDPASKQPIFKTSVAALRKAPR
ncbi:molybdopterin oxidoreductase family protein [Gordonia soli]|uniref:Putative nitrate reductase n=1 Tax=Gordonia soli NBRC 108243 TaxID=1223545 RepID=M0QGD3_9ACTN|nr:nitrate reductase [Gordonia soli]GAC67643.1 putative nitrate reductase [Gordonia soli NBRC 108243]